ncbi:MAG: hypothetical protein N2C14_14725 [Planctomycetales bacterium]
MRIKKTISEMIRLRFSLRFLFLLTFLAAGCFALWPKARDDQVTVTVWISDPVGDFQPGASVMVWLQNQSKSGMTPSPGYAQDTMVITQNASIVRLALTGKTRRSSSGVFRYAEAVATIQIDPEEIIKLRIIKHMCEQDEDEYEYEFSLIPIK